MSDVLQALQIEKYITINAQEEKSLHIYAQLQFCYVKVAQMTLMYNQLMIAQNNLDWQFRIHIPKSKKDITIPNFPDRLDSKAFIWKKMAKHEIGLMGLALKLRYNFNSSF